jgi:hypothetical protein
MWSHLHISGYETLLSACSFLLTIAILSIYFSCVMSKQP